MDVYGPLGDSPLGYAERFNNKKMIELINDTITKQQNLYDSLNTPQNLNESTSNSQNINESINKSENPNEPINESQKRFKI